MIAENYEDFVLTLSQDDAKALAAVHRLETPGEMIWTGLERK